MSNWAKFAKYTTPSEMFFSLWSASRAYKHKRLNSAMVAENIKDCARRFKELPEMFSNKSYKIRGILSLKPMGVTQSIIITKMDHRTALASRAYQRPTLEVVILGICWTERERVAHSGTMWRLYRMAYISGSLYTISGSYIYILRRGGWALEGGETGSVGVEDRHSRKVQ